MLWLVSDPLYTKEDIFFKAYEVGNEKKEIQILLNNFLIVIFLEVIYL